MSLHSIPSKTWLRMWRRLSVLGLVPKNGLGSGFRFRLQVLKAGSGRLARKVGLESQPGRAWREAGNATWSLISDRGQPQSWAIGHWPLAMAIGHGHWPGLS